MAGKFPPPCMKLSRDPWNEFPGCNGKVRLRGLERILLPVLFRIKEFVHKEVRTLFQEDLLAYHAPVVAKNVHNYRLSRL